MAEKSSVEERLEKLEKHKSRDAQRAERAEQLEKLKNTPIKRVPHDPNRINMSYAQVVAAKKAKKDEDADIKRYLAEKKAKKSETKEEPKEEVKAPVTKKGRPKKVE